jgi:hypothetical protein
MTVTAHRFIVQRSSTDEFTFAIVDAAVADCNSDIDFFDRLSRAVTRWVRATDEGRRWYFEETSEDANIGDLAAYGIADELRRELRDEGITGLKIETYCNDAAANWTYDSLLVQEASLGPIDGD